MQMVSRLKATCFPCIKVVHEACNLVITTCTERVLCIWCIHCNTDHVFAYGLMSFFCHMPTIRLTFMKNDPNAAPYMLHFLLVILLSLDLLYASVGCCPPSTSVFYYCSLLFSQCKYLNQILIAVLIGAQIYFHRTHLSRARPRWNGMLVLGFCQGKCCCLLIAITHNRSWAIRFAKRLTDNWNTSKEQRGPEFLQAVD